MNLRELLLHLSLTSYSRNLGSGAPELCALSAATLAKLMVVLKSGYNKDFYSYGISDFVALGFSQTVAHAIVTILHDSALLEKELELLEKYHLSWVTLLDDFYPSYLAHSLFPPLVIYWQGESVWYTGNTGAMKDKTIDKTIVDKNGLVGAKLFSIVGSRLGDNYGKSVVDYFVPALVAQDWIIVSGGARGIDTFAHEATLAHGGKTIVVLGSGLLHTYPASNNTLFKRIIDQGGTLVSCFNLDAQPIAWRFPARNRVIAGLSQATLVAQAAQKSGALITASYALQEGRQVFAVPGALDNPLSAGCHELILQGATIAGSLEMLFRELGQEFGRVHTGEVSERTMQQKIFEKPVGAGNLVKNVVKKERVSQETTQDSFLEYLVRPIGFADLAQLATISEYELQKKLLEYQLDGKIEQDFAGLWQKIER